MKNLKHTPAPWTINKYNSIVDSKGNTVTVRGMALNMGSNHSEEINANQKLIASAPELLEALISIKTHIDGNLIDLSSSGYLKNEIENAIKKATE